MTDIARVLSKQRRNHDAHSTGIFDIPILFALGPLSSFSDSLRDVIIATEPQLICFPATNLDLSATLKGGGDFWKFFESWSPGYEEAESGSLPNLNFNSYSCYLHSFFKYFLVQPLFGRNLRRVMEKFFDGEIPDRERVKDLLSDEEKFPEKLKPHVEYLVDLYYTRKKLTAREDDTIDIKVLDEKFPVLQTEEHYKKPSRWSDPIACLDHLKLVVDMSHPATAGLLEGLLVKRKRVYMCPSCRMETGIVYDEFPYLIVEPPSPIEALSEEETERFEDLAKESYRKPKPKPEYALAVDDQKTFRNLNLENVKKVLGKEKFNIFAQEFRTLDYPEVVRRASEEEVVKLSVLAHCDHCNQKNFSRIKRINLVEFPDYISLYMKEGYYTSMGLDFPSVKLGTVWNIEGEEYLLDATIIHDKNHYFVVGVDPRNPSKAWLHDDVLEGKPAQEVYPEDTDISGAEKVLRHWDEYTSKTKFPRIVGLKRKRAN